MVLLAAVAALLAPAGATPVSAAVLVGEFEQDHRVTTLVLESGTDDFAAANQLGGAFAGALARDQVNNGFDAAIGNGSLNVLLHMPGLTDPTGGPNPSFATGVSGGAPITPPGNPAPYDGSADLDWWYEPSAADLGSEGAPTHSLASSITSGVLAAGPGLIDLQVPIGGMPAALSMTDVQLRADVGSATSPLESTNGFPPGHLPDEDVPPTVTSFQTLDQGRLKGDVSAGDLDATPIPSALVGSGFTNCSQAYTTSNTMLDLIVGGCSIIGTAQVVPTQPDRAVSPGPPYTFSASPGTRRVSSCTRNGAAAVLADCLADAEYSVYFTFTTGRVIVRGPCAPGSYSDSGRSPCNPADPGSYVDTSGATEQTPCPEGMTSLDAGARSCSTHLTTTSPQCSPSAVRIGVTTTCTATVANDVPGSLPSDDVTWSGLTGDGTFSSPTCSLVAAAASSSCSVTYRPAPGTAGVHELRGAYEGDATHASSAGEDVVTVTLRKSSTAVDCTRTKLRHGRSTDCTAVVSDVGPGTPVTPRGKVGWAAPARFGTFDRSTCKLASQGGVRSCTVSFTTHNKIRGTIELKASYTGDTSHRASGRRFELTVT